MNHRTFSQILSKINESLMFELFAYLLALFTYIALVYVYVKYS